MNIFDDIRGARREGDWEMVLLGGTLLVMIGALAVLLVGAGVMFVMWLPPFVSLGITGGIWVLWRIVEAVTRP